MTEARYRLYKLQEEGYATGTEAHLCVLDDEVSRGEDKGDE